MTRATDIVVTTIWEPAWLQGYLDDIRAFGHQDSVTIRIICDRKTPATVFQAAADAQKAGFRIDCPSLDDQAKYLRQLGLTDEFIPWNTDNRRNIGFLRALENGAEVVISIDDDNYCEPGSDFVGTHHCVGQPAGGPLRCADHAAWFNICSLLTTDRTEPIFPRGFPYAARTPHQLCDPGPPGAGPAANPVIAVNAGLWLDDPDVDAITRLALKPAVSSADPEPVLLGLRTWSPINTQNTALMRDAMAAYYYVRMGFPLQGMKIDRFGDILSGYFVQKCVKHLGHAVRIGSPVARHRRTPHNLLADLYHELAGIVLVEELVPWLQELRLSGNTYAAAYRSLAEALAASADRFRGFVWDQGGRDFLRETSRSMLTWLEVLTRLSRGARR